MPSTGRSDCNPAIAKTRLSKTTQRIASASHLRHAPTWTSVFNANQITHASAGASSSK